MEALPVLELKINLPPEEIEALAQRVAEVLEDRRDDGFLDAVGPPSTSG
jgi:hypothetical protein